MDTIEYPGPKDVTYQISIHLKQWFIRRRFSLRFVNNSSFSPLKWALDLNKSGSPFPGDGSYQVWLGFHINQVV